MARSRLLKPDFFKDEELAERSAHARLLFAGLWTIADRDGWVEDRPKRIKAEIFPYEAVDVEKLRDELLEHGFITRCNVDGVDYLYIDKFTKHQHPHPKEPKSEVTEKYRLAEKPCNATAKHCPAVESRVETMAKQSESLTIPSIPSLTIPSAAAEAAVEAADLAVMVGLPRAKRSKSTSILPPGFLRFWDAYPNTSRRADRAGCLRVWQRNDLEPQADFILEHLAKCVRSDSWRRGFEPSAHKYLHQRLFESQPPPETPNDNRQHHSKPHRAGEFEENITL